MLHLPAVSLVCIDFAEPALALAALEQTLNRVHFAEALFITGSDPQIDVLRTVVAPEPDGPAGRLRFVAHDLAQHLRTEHALLIQWDAFVINVAAWDEAFMAYDWVAPLTGAARLGDNEGVVLLSRRLLSALATVPLSGADSLRTAVAQLAASPRATGTGVRFAPRRVCQRFAFVDEPPAGQPFAFQGLFNMWMFFQPPDLDAFLAMAPNSVLASDALEELATNLRDLGRAQEAEAIAHAIKSARTKMAGDPSAAIGAPGSGGHRAGAGPIGRNDPCPCGSGRKYKQCHGRIDVAPALPSRTTVAVTGSGRPRGAVAVLFHRAQQAFERDDLVAAEGLYRELLAIDPNQSAAIEYLGVIAMRARRYADAEPLLRRALELDTEAPEFHNNLGLLHHARGQFVQASECYTAALSLTPAYAPAHNNRGLALQETGRLDDAIACFRRATALAPAFAEAHWNLGLALLADEQFEEGLLEHEWRLKVEKDRAWWAQRQQFPEWGGGSLAGKRILVLAEQGMGDQLQFVRYAALLANAGATVVVETAHELIELIRTVPGVAEVVPRDGPYPRCDVQVALMSLPLRCATRSDRIPLTDRYLATDAARAGRWQALLGPRTRPRVGIAWAGNPEHVRDRYRSMPLAHCVPLLHMEGIEWISLQKGAATAEIDRLPATCSIRDMGRHSETFADLAALVEMLDLVITVDTSAVHVAGALGRPTLLLLDSGHDWRWPRNGSDGRWYRSVRLLHQPARGDWDSVIAAAQVAVSEILRTAAA